MLEAGHQSRISSRMVATRYLSLNRRASSWAQEALERRRTRRGQRGRQRRSRGGSLWSEARLATSVG